MARKKLSTLELFIASLFAATIIIVTCQIIWRYAFNDSLRWTEEISRYIFVWIVFLGAAVAVKDGTHIKIDSLLEKLGGKKRKYTDIVLLFLTILTCSYFVYYGILFVIGTKNTFSTALALPINLFVYSALPLSCLIAIYYCAKRIATIVKENQV